MVMVKNGNMKPGNSIQTCSARLSDTGFNKEKHELGRRKKLFSLKKKKSFYRLKKNYY
jgi:hypothetical protein